ncbi:hypothetical protein ACH4Y0_02665 [Streptomyces sp. NPDC020707]|uniref:hypothetical protein n=1 Tax=Streptomyces sp. NPDC020707 TaxID=3365084 RepID=UPI00379DAC2D
MRARIADVLARTYDGQALADLRDEHAEAHLEAAEAVLVARLLWRLGGPQYGEARQLRQTELAAANRVLAAYNPGLIVSWANLPGAERKDNR